MHHHQKRQKKRWEKDGRRQHTQAPGQGLPKQYFSCLSKRLWRGDGAVVNCDLEPCEESCKQKLQEPKDIYLMNEMLRIGLSALSDLRSACIG